MIKKQAGGKDVWRLNQVNKNVWKLLLLQRTLKIHARLQISPKSDGLVTTSAKVFYKM